MDFTDEEKTTAQTIFNKGRLPSGNIYELTREDILTLKPNRFIGDAVIK